MRAIPHIIILLLLSTLISFSQDYEKVDSIVKLYPTSFEKTEDLADLINSDFSIQVDKTRAIYTWIAMNIKYGSDKKSRSTYNSNEEQKFREDLALKTLKHKRAVCEGYATLFKILCDLSSIECEIIHGTSKTKKRDIGRFPKGTDHAWNAVKINEKWRLIDVTWGAGYTETKNGKFVHDFTELYFFTDPEVFFKKHYPKNIDWLFIKRSEKEFARLPLYYRNGLDSEIKIINPEKGIIKIRNNKPIQIVIRSNQLEHVSFKFNNEKKSKQIEPRIDGDLFYYDIKPGNGMYLTIYVNYNAFIAYRLERK